jgi:hypothetical protein
VVPGERADAVARADPELLQRVAEPPDPLAEVAVGVAVVLARSEPGDDLLLGEQAFGPPEKGVQQQLAVEHQSLHRPLRVEMAPSVVRAGCRAL